MSQFSAQDATIARNYNGGKYTLLKAKKTSLPGVLLIEPDVFEDYRGEYSMLYSEKDYSVIPVIIDGELDAHVKCPKFVETDISVSRYGVLRGIHGDDKTWKLVSCVSGCFYLVVLCFDKSSPHYGQWQSFTLSDKNRKQVLIPPKHGNGHLCLSNDGCVFHYAQSEYYDPDSQFTIRYDDPEFGIRWPMEPLMVSERDEKTFPARRAVGAIKDESCGI